MLTGKTPADVQKALGDIPSWKAGTLGKGGNKHGGWKFAEYTAQGDATGKQIRYNPSSTHHPEVGPYWRVNAGNGQGGIIPGGVE